MKKIALTKAIKPCNDFSSGNQKSVLGKAVLADPENPSKPAQLIVNFDANPVKFNETNYSVAKTDYDNYSVVYTCREGEVGCPT